MDLRFCSKIAVSFVVAVALVASVWSPASLADDAPKASKVVPVLQKDLPDLPGKEGLVATVELPPGFASKAHRHDADVFVYMLEGVVEMQVAGGQPVTLHPGETFYESPHDVHTVARNISNSQPAKFLVLYVKTKGAPSVAPADKP